MYFKKYIFPRFCVSQSLCRECDSVQLAVISTCKEIPCKQVLCLPKHRGIKMFQVHTGQAGTPISKQGVIDFSEIYDKPLNTSDGLRIRCCHLKSLTNFFENSFHFFRLSSPCHFIMDCCLLFALRARDPKLPEPLTCSELLPVAGSEELWGSVMLTALVGLNQIYLAVQKMSIFFYSFFPPMYTSNFS